jgi:predicted ATPase
VILVQHLNALESSGLVRLAQTLPELEYLFRHALIQDAAYSSLVKQDRRLLHRAVAEALERTYPDRMEELAAVLAQHFEAAGDTGGALKYLTLAGEDAARRYANPEALALFTRALALSDDAPPETAMHVLEARGQVYEFLSEYDPALTDYEKALALAQQSGLVREECRIMSRMAWLYWLSGKGELALKTARAAESTARTLNDHAVALRAFMVVGLVAQAEGRLAEAYPRLRQSLFASRATRERALEGESLFYLGIEDNFMGRFGRASVFARKACEIKHRLGDRGGAMLSLYLLGRAEGGRGNYDVALEALEAGFAVAEETHNPFGRAMYANQRAWLSAELGDWETAYELDRAGLEVARAAPIRPPEISTLLNLVLDCTMLNRPDEADEYVLALQKWMGRPEFGFHGWRWQTREADARVRLHMARGQHMEAAAVVTDLLDRAARTGSRKYLARGVWLRGEILYALGAIETVEANWVAARDLADAMGNLPIRVQVRRSLMRLYLNAEKDDATDRMRVEIDALIASLDRRLRHPDLRRSFDRGLAREMKR